MSKYYHKPYSRRRGKKKKGKKIIVVLILLIAAGIYMLNRSGDDNGEDKSIDLDMDELLAIDEPEAKQEARIPDEPAKVEVRESKPAAKVVEKFAKVAAPKVVEVEDTGVTSKEAKDLIAKGEGHIAKDEVLAARFELNDALLRELSSLDRQKVKGMLTLLANDWLFSKKVLEGDTLVTTYSVMSGDNLGAIGNTYKVPHQILVKINRLSSDRALRAGSNIKVINGPFHVIIDRSSFTMDLYLQNTFVKSYDVGLGKEGSETPVGRWRVKDGGKMVQPPWFDEKAGKTYHASDADYPLGARWIAIEGLDANTKTRTGFALHGTKEPETIRTKSSNGCIRLINEEIIEVYGLLYPVHSLVQIVD